MSASLKSRLARMEGRAATSKASRTESAESEAWGRLLKSLRAELLATCGNSHEATMLALDDRLTAECITPADRIALAHMLDADLAAADTTAADVVALMAEVLRAY